MRPQRFMRGNTTRYGGRRKPGEMTKAEQAYADQLEARKIASEIIRWDFEAMTFKLADGCRYTPDFAVWLANGEMELIDVKGTGPVDDKSIVKAKVAAERFPMFRFVMERQRPKKDGGGWHRQEY